MLSHTRSLARRDDSLSSSPASLPACLLGLPRSPAWVARPDPESSLHAATVCWSLLLLVSRRSLGSALPASLLPLPLAAAASRALYLSRPHHHHHRQRQARQLRTRKRRRRRASERERCACLSAAPAAPCSASSPCLSLCRGEPLPQASKHSVAGLSHSHSDSSCNSGCLTGARRTFCFQLIFSAAAPAHPLLVSSFLITSHSSLIRVSSDLA